MAPTSGTFNFQSIPVELIIREAYERLGILGEFVEPQKLDSAKRSIDFLLLEWMSKSINLWTLSHTYLSLVTGQGQYTLPNTVSNIIQANLRTSTRQLNGTALSSVRQVTGNALSAIRELGGTPAASSGIAANAFDGNPATACTQTAPNGNISYDYGADVDMHISTVGIISQATLQYTITVEESDDNVIWTNVIDIPVQTYTANTLYKFALPNIAGRAFRIRETGGATLNIQELYFTTLNTNANATNAFDGDPTTSFLDIWQNGILEFSYTNLPAPIATIGITSQVTRQYTLIVEYSNDGNTWTNLFNIPVQTYTANILYKFNVVPPRNAGFFRIRETGGSVLNIQELYLVSYSSNTNANNAFDGNPATAFVDLWLNGSITYDYGANVTQQITFIGIQSNILGNYSISVEYSQDNVIWTTLFIIPTQLYPAGLIEWFDVPTPISARYYRLRETEGATLNLQEVYFNNNTLDFTISNVSRYEYLTYPNKYLQSRPCIYYLDRQITPILNVWPTPTSQYNCLFYSYKQMMQDVGMFYTNALQIPSRLYPALIWGLTWLLAIKYKPDSATMFKAEYEQSFEIAAIEDKEEATISIRGSDDYMGGY